MPKACPYNLKDYIYTYAEQMHRVFGLTLGKDIWLIERILQRAYTGLQD